ncbi:MAG TPA: TetR/AcrR family transcriptional regulator [Streptosporangiaceae bacterium]|nr:TetR/AcrR family transcriptional regulator [Streptosporangiaceae bacterium]
MVTAEPDTLAGTGDGTRYAAGHGGRAAQGAEPVGATTAAGDGRRLRRDRNRQAVVDALLDLYSEGNLRPCTGEIAERAGLSPRSLFRYFDDIDDLCRTAVRRQQQRAQPLIAIQAEARDPLSARIDALITQRLRLFEAVGPAALVSRLQAPFQALLAVEVAKTRVFLRDQIRELFAAELADMPPAAAGNMLAAADVLCSFESYQLLQLDQGLAAPAMRDALTASLSVLLTPDSPAGRAGAISR